jgi:uncharacterized protein (TIGR00730 family)
MRICVYCASSAQAPVHFGDAAYELGRLFAANNVTTVFGGGGAGSMARLADGVHAGKGNIVGVMPRFMKDLEWGHSGLQSVVWTDGMAERKALLLEGTDAVIALPGGCGTFEELLEVITLKRLCLYLKPIVIVNQEGFYDPLLALFKRSVKEHFMDERHLEMFSVVQQVSGVLDAVRNARPWGPEAREFAVMR